MRLIDLLNLPKQFRQWLCGESADGHVFKRPLRKLPKCEKCGIPLEDYIDVNETKKE